MQVTVKGKSMQISDALKDYAAKKVTRLEKHFNHIKEAIVTMNVQRNMHVVEITLEGDGILMRGEERTADMYASIDLVVEKLDKQIGKLKSKRIEKPRAESARVQAGLEAAAERPEPAEPEEGRIVRTKRISIKPMNPEEAAEQMELINHDFYIFMNQDTEQMNVIYKRTDGNYGLIEPEQA